MSIEMPTSFWFYTFSIASGLLAKYGDTIHFDLAKEKLTAPLTRILALDVWLVFVIWFIYDTAYREKLLAAPSVFSGIVISIFFAGYASYRMKKCNITQHVLKKRSQRLLLQCLLVSLTSWLWSFLHFWAAYLVMYF